MSDADEPLTTRVSDDGETRIPERIRERLGIEPGDRVAWSADGVEATVEKQSSSARGSALPDDISDEKRREVAAKLDEYVKRKRRGEWDGESSEMEE